MAVEQSPASVVITDRNASIEYVNPKFLQVTGYTLEEVIGQNPAVLNSGLRPIGRFGRGCPRERSGAESFTTGSRARLP